MSRLAGMVIGYAGLVVMVLFLLICLPFLLAVYGLDYVRDEYLS